MMSLRAIATVLVLPLALVLAGCEANSSLSSVSVTPSSAALTEVGQTAQFTALGNYTRGKHPSTTRDITNQVQWSSSAPSVATVNDAGLVTAVASGTATVSASINGSLGVVAGTANVNVSVNGLVSLAIIPVTQTLNNPGETSQFVAIGSFSSTPTTQDVTNQVKWSSSDVSVATINSAGLATAGIVAGQTTITAIGTSNDANISGTSVLNVTTNGGGGQLPTLAVYAVGLGAGTVTSSPAGINCLSGAGCTGNFPLNTVVTLTAMASQGSQVGANGGWSSNCTPVLPIDPTLESSSCTITMSTNSAGQPANEAVGVIFNLQP